jgi:putative flippase GtrA
MMQLLHFFLRDPRLFLRYVLAGAIAASVETSLFMFFYQGMHWPLLAANTLALSCAILFCFILQRQWTFRARGGFGRQLKLYLLMQLISALLNNLLIYILITCWMWPPLPAKVVQIGIVFLWNFSFCKLAIFRVAAPAPSACTLPP